MDDTSASLLHRLIQRPDDSDAWRRLTDVYTPLIKNWLSRQAVAASDMDDLVQEVMLIVLRKLPQFEHNERPGAFRRWLRSVTVHCVRNFVRERRLRPTATGASDFLETLNQLEDSGSDASKIWDQEHDLHVTEKLLEQIQPQFEPLTWQAFQRVCVDEVKARDVAEELGMSVGSVYTAKSRVLNKLRQEGDGLLD